ncbi:hypothetical protein, partial [Plasmodium yoelii yoelii]
SIIKYKNYVSIVLYVKNIIYIIKMINF